MPENFNSRLRSLIERKGLKQKEISELTGISEGAMSNYMVNRIPKADQLFRLASALGVSMEFLLTGQGPGTVTKCESSVVPYTFVSAAGGAGVRLIPVIGWAHAGELVDYDETADQEAARIPTECRDPKAFGVRLEGDSMRPLYQEGDMLVVMPGQEIHQGCLAVVRHADGVLFRRVDLVPDLMRLIPLNDRYSVGEYRREEILWAYPVWGSWRQVWK